MLAGNYIYHHKQLLWQATSGLGVFYQTVLRNAFLTQTLGYQRARQNEEDAVCCLSRTTSVLTALLMSFY